MSVLPGGTTSQTVLFVLDDSYSMGQRLGGGTIFSFDRHIDRQAAGENLLRGFELLEGRKAGKDGFLQHLEGFFGRRESRPP
jgi:hypothetical protein